MNSRRIVRLSCLVALLLLLGWGVGFVSFVQSVESYRQIAIDESTNPTDAVVVLTGGSERLSEGINLLRAGKAKKLLISGVHPSVKFSALLAQSEISPELKDCCVILGREANNTIGNAHETHAFMINEGFHSLRLVTANYHMPRSLLLFKTMLPNTTIVPHSVSPDTVDLAQWWLHPGTFSLLGQEYAKYIYAWIMLSV